MRTHRESWEPGKQMPLRYLGIAKLDRADGVGHPIGTDVERIGKQRLARMNRCALPDVVADIVRVALSHHLDVAAAGGPDGAANAVPGVTEATAMGPNGVSDAGHLWLLMRCGPADETHRAARTAHGQSPRRQDTCRPGDRPTRAGSSWPRRNRLMFGAYGPFFAVSGWCALGSIVWLLVLLASRATSGERVGRVLFRRGGPC